MRVGRVEMLIDETQQLRQWVYALEEERQDTQHRLRQLEDFQRLAMQRMEDEDPSEEEPAGEGSGPLTGGIPGPGATGGALSVAALRSRWEAPPSPLKAPMQSVPQVQLGSRPFEDRGGASGSQTGGIAVSPRKDPLAGVPPPGLSLGTTPPAWTASGIPGPVPSGVVVPTPVNPKLDPPP